MRLHKETSFAKADLTVADPTKLAVCIFEVAGFFPLRATCVAARCVHFLRCGLRHTEYLIVLVEGKLSLVNHKFTASLECCTTVGLDHSIE